ncbi:CMGC/CDK protein kinase [Mycena pura]|uniref:cyclin-dependent kinase n=1 Tax=Mycena pura TaxID=153505 RepID=A0AAD6VBJ4_9AGAR|nr:CMGC/CDK protein kinase [Mycena pura]
MESDAPVHDLTDDRYYLIEEGPTSTVSRTWTAFKGSEPQWIVAKSSTIRKKFSKEPHDIVKELRILSKLSHVNTATRFPTRDIDCFAKIIPVLSHFKDTSASILTIYFPYISFSLARLLVSPAFSPFPSPPSPHLIPDPTQEAHMMVVAKSITFQILSALAYLHDPARRIAHRDIKPANILLTPEGCVVLIDFGVACEDAGGNSGDLWPEDSGRMYFEVSTGAYRAPELLFSTRSYDAAAIDMWSFGTVLAEMFTALRVFCDDGDDEEPVYSAQAGDAPFVVKQGLRPDQPGTQWCRDTLFNGRRGEIGLAWSIFKIRGTPTDETWPTFRDLPGASSVEFTVVPSALLAPFLPNLPSSSAGVVDLIESFLTYPPSRRLAASDAVNHKWLAGQILLPSGESDESLRDERIVFEVDKRSSRTCYLGFCREGVSRKRLDYISPCP